MDALWVFVTRMRGGDNVVRHPRATVFVAGLGQIGERGAGAALWAEGALPGVGG